MYTKLNCSHFHSILIKMSTERMTNLTATFISQSVQHATNCVTQLHSNSIEKYVLVMIFFWCHYSSSRKLSRGSKDDFSLIIFKQTVLTLD